MEQVSIRVRGSYATKVAPERGTVHAAVGYDGPEVEPLLAQVESVAGDLVDSLQALADDGPVRTWSAGQVQVSAHRPWNESGTQLPLVHQVRVELTAEFTDVSALGEWLGNAARMGAGVQWIDWALTDDSRRQLERQARAAAVHDARARAQDYADALRLGEVHVVTLADTGLLSRPEPVAMMAMKGMEDASGGMGVVLQPEDIEVSAEVEAEFVIVRP